MKDLAQDLGFLILDVGAGSRRGGNDAGVCRLDKDMGADTLLTMLHWNAVLFPN